MTHSKILQTLSSYVSQHLDGIRGSLGQEPYLGDIFSQFAEAQLLRNDSDGLAPQLTGDGVVDGILERLSEHSIQDPEKRQELAKRIGRLWDAWEYAWEAYPRFHGKEQS